ncbi:MAG TPA: hypothetical protein VNA24_30825 [Hyalangium sp.]|nr:hypothetical protein [Hyalangium sp.]
MAHSSTAALAAKWSDHGNQGADGPYLAPRAQRTLGFAWMNASVLLLLEGLSPELREALDVGVPDEKLPGPAPLRAAS